MEIVLSRRAKTDLEQIVAYIAADDPHAAQEFSSRVLQSLHLLADSPHRGRPGRVAGTRELILHESYIAAYRVHENTIFILTVRHAARLWPDSF